MLRSSFAALASVAFALVGRGARCDPSFTDDLRAAFGEALCRGDDCALALIALWCDAAACSATDAHDGRRLRAAGAPAARVAHDLHDPIGSDRDDPGRSAVWRVSCSSAPQHTTGYGWAPAGACEIEMKAGDGVLASALGDFFEHSLGRHDDTPELEVACSRGRCRADGRAVTRVGFAHVIAARGGGRAHIGCSISDGHAIGEQSLRITRCAISPARAP